jgi:hypothetical protein
MNRQKGYEIVHCLFRVGLACLVNYGGVEVMQDAFRCAFYFIRIAALLSYSHHQIDYSFYNSIIGLCLLLHKSFFLAFLTFNSMMHAKLG